MKKIAILLCVFIMASCSSDGGGNDMFEDVDFGGAGGLGDLGSFELSQCQQDELNLTIKYNEKVNEAKLTANLDALQEENYLFTVEYNKTYNAYNEDLIKVFELEGGDRLKLDEELNSLLESFIVKLDNLSVDIESQEWRDESRILDMELEESKVKLYSVKGGNTEILAIEFLNWFKENKQKLGEMEDNIHAVSDSLDEELKILDEELEEAIKILNCS